MPEEIKEHSKLDQIDNAFHKGGIGYLRSITGMNKWLGQCDVFVNKRKQGLAGLFS